MAYKTLLFGTEKSVKKMRPLYEREALHGTFKIVGVNFVESKIEEDNLIDIDLVIVSSQRNFYILMKQLEALGVPREKIIDGRVFEMPYLDFPRFLKESIAYGILEGETFDSNSRMIYPKVYTAKTKNGRIRLTLGTKSYIRSGSVLDGKGLITLGKYSSFATKIFFSLGKNASHNYLNVGTIPMTSLDWPFPKKFWPPQGVCKIEIGSDVWCGRGCNLKCTNPAKPLIIGDGAIIASDSVVVKSVPPYAIVGGNPAQIIKYRFPPHIIEALLRIKWWDWDIDKLYENYKYFNDVEKFISIHDK